MTRGGLDYQQVNLAATHTPKVVGSSLALFFPLHLKSTKFAQNLSALHPFLGQPHLITCLDQYIRLCPGPQAPVFAPQSALLQRPEGACEHLSQVTSLLCSEPSMAPSSTQSKSQSPCCAHRPCSTTSQSTPHVLCSSHNGLLTVP